MGYVFHSTLTIPPSPYTLQSYPLIKDRVTSMKGFTAMFHMFQIPLSGRKAVRSVDKRMH